MYDPESTEKHVFRGRRVTRGLYRGQKGCINADINGAANIVRKYRPDADFSPLDAAILMNPRRVGVLNTARMKPQVPVRKKSKAATQATA